MIFFNEYQQTIRAVKKALPAVAMIRVFKEDKTPISSSTAFFASQDGYLLTNLHNVEDEELKYFIFWRNEEYPAQVLARDKVADIAVLKIEPKKNSQNENPQNFPYLLMGDSSKLELGQTVLAIGNALFDLENTVSRGVISGLFRKIRTNREDDPLEFTGLIQTDAAINPGNSGGPLIDLKGRVIGINTAMILGAENIGFAIPINQAKKILEEVKKYGKIIRPSLGVKYYLIDEELKKEHHLPFDYGAFVVYGNPYLPSGIIKGGLAEKIGLKEGDIILKINDQEIKKPNTLSKILSEYQLGDKIKITYWREGKISVIEAVLN